MPFYNSVSVPVRPESAKEISRLTIKIIAQDCSGEIRLTDTQLQPGSAATGWVSHVSEIEWTEDGE